MVTGQWVQKTFCCKIKLEKLLYSYVRVHRGNGGIETVTLFFVLKSVRISYVF